MVVRKSDSVRQILTTIIHHLFTSRCKCLLILATKLPILGIILYRKGINPRCLIGTISTHLQRDAPGWCTTSKLNSDRFTHSSGDDDASDDASSDTTEDGPERDFSFLFGKSAILVPRPHQNIPNFDFELCKSNSTLTF